ncbi:MAG: DUF5916 domain-containing protein, partial [Fidelibacterota bacterium]
MTPGIEPFFLVAVLLVCFAPGRGETVDGIDPSTFPLKVATATRVTTPPVIDGDLTDAAWQEALPVKDLLQVEPGNLDLPTEKTEVRILYDDSNLYVGFRNYDSEPQKIMGRLARRDSWMQAAANNADWISIGLDTRDDNRTGYAFTVNAAGVELDAYIYDDDNYDMSWNGVWESRVKIDSVGWTAEFRLPFFLFWFSAEPEQTWGLELNRAIYRKQERQEWPGKKRGVKGVVSRFGVLRGIHDIPTPRQLEILPYVLGGYHPGEGSRLTQNLGIDLQYGLASNTTLNLTFNPDFGQVEADPSVLNLTAFETFFEEKRPFFVEGGSFFKNRIQLFHSRRIGKQPGFFSSDGDDIVERPQATSILGAAKVMGKTLSGMEFGIIESVTSEEHGMLELSGEGTAHRERILLEPYTNYFVGRVKSSAFNDLSTVGFMVTDVRRRGAVSASVGGLDWRLKFLDNQVTFSGQAAASRTEKGVGTAGRFYLAYDHPVWWNLNLVGSRYGDAFEINDLGFLDRNGTWTLGSFGGIRRQDPWGPFLRNELGFRFFYTSRNDGLILSRSLNLEQTNTTKRYWTFGFGTKVEFSSYDDGDTFKDSRAWEIARPVSRAAWAFLQSDIRKRVIVSPVFGSGKDELGGWGYLAKLEVTLNPADHVSLSLAATRSFMSSKVEWVGIDDGSATDPIIYSNSKQVVNDLRLRMDWTFS